MTDIDLTDGNTKGRHMQPSGYVSSHQTQLEHVARELGAMRLAADIIAEGGGASVGDRAAATDISQRAGAAARVLRAIASGALVALVAVGLSMGGARPAAAAEDVQPDPVTVSVTLTAGSVAVGVPVTARSTDSHSRHCASVWGPTSYGRGFVGRICSRHSAFTVPVTLDSRYVPVGRSTMAVTDDVDPLGTFPQVVNLTARRPSRFGVGTYIDRGNGDLFVSASLYAYTPAVAAYTPQKYSPVQVWESTKRGWRLRATVTTNSAGRASGIAHLGGGLHYIRLVRPIGETVVGTQGQVRLVDVTEVPFDTV